MKYAFSTRLKNNKGHGRGKDNGQFLHLSGLCKSALDSLKTIQKRGYLEDYLAKTNWVDFSPGASNPSIMSLIPHFLMVSVDTVWKSTKHTLINITNDIPWRARKPNVANRMQSIPHNKQWKGCNEWPAENRNSFVSSAFDFPTRLVFVHFDWVPLAFQRL